MDEKVITVLLIEDNPADVRLIRELLGEEKTVHYEITHVSELETGLKRLAEKDIDAVLLDLTLPDSHGIDTFYRVNAHSPELPIVVLTGLKDDLLAVEMLRAGAQDFLSKGSINYCVLHQTLRHAMERKHASESNSPKQDQKLHSPEQDQLLALLCYALKKPMASLLSAISPITSDPTKSADLLQTLELTRAYLERQSRFIDDTLEYSRIATRGDVLRPTDCETTLNAVLSNLKLSIDETRAIITHDPLPTIWADATQLRRLFHNLIDNAIKFRGADAPKIHVSAQRHGANYIFSIRDNGIGFDPVYSERIFGMFERLRSDDSSPSSGAGLAICRKIAQRHGGQIWAESEPGQGSCLLFTLPGGENRSI
jgi:two-component system, sensor histidine kinase and response regulator